MNRVSSTALLVTWEILLLVSLCSSHRQGLRQTNVWPYHISDFIRAGSTPIRLKLPLGEVNGHNNRGAGQGPGATESILHGS